MDKIYLSFCFVYISVFFLKVFMVIRASNRPDQKMIIFINFQRAGRFVKKMSTCTDHTWLILYQIAFKSGVYLYF